MRLPGAGIAVVVLAVIRLLTAAGDQREDHVAGIYNETVQILAKPGINTVADLKGKTVG